MSSNDTKNRREKDDDFPVETWIFYEGFVQKMIPYKGTFLVLRIAARENHWSLSVGYLTKENNVVLLKNIAIFLCAGEAVYVSDDVYNLRGEKITDPPRIATFLKALFKEIGKHRFEDITHVQIRSLFTGLFDFIMNKW